MLPTKVDARTLDLESGRRLSLTSVITNQVTLVPLTFSCVSHNKAKGHGSKMYKVQGTRHFIINRGLSTEQPDDIIP